VGTAHPNKTVESQNYSIELYELAFEARVELDELATLISVFTGISSDYISSKDIFFNNIAPFILSMSIEIEYQSRDFKTWAKLYCGNYELSNAKFIKLALFLSKELKTDVSIPNPSYPEYPNPTEIIIYPDEFYQEAYLEEKEEEEEYTYVLEIYKKESRKENDEPNILELILELENIEKTKEVLKQ
jgi:hypothetical protein